MNIPPNEALAYAQSAHGVNFAFGRFIDRFEEAGLDKKYSQIKSREKTDGNTYVYKVPSHINLEVGDVVIVQVLDGHFGLVLVQELDDEPPASDVWDFTRNMKWVVGVVPVEYSKTLTQNDRDSLKAISKASLKARVSEINQALGFDVTQVVPQVGKGEEKEVPLADIEDPDAVIDEDDVGVMFRDENGNWVE